MTGSGWGYFACVWTITLTQTHTHTDLPETGAEVTHNKGVIVNAFLSKLSANGYPG